VTPSATAAAPRSTRRKTVAAPSCATCFFGVNGLCALDADEPCPTYRPAGPDGLSPPRQLRFQFRRPALETSAWAFPSAEEQAELHQR